LTFRCIAWRLGGREVFEQAARLGADHTRILWRYLPNANTAYHVRTYVFWAIKSSPGSPCPSFPHQCACFLVPKGREKSPMSVPSCPFSQNHYGWLHDLRVLLLCRVLQNLRTLLMRNNRTVYYAMFAAHVLFSESYTGNT
jgi:hypothetical protein